MYIHISIETRDPYLSHDLMESSSLSVGKEIIIPGQGRLQYQGEIRRFSIDIPAIIELTLHYTDEIVVGIVANWLFEKLRGRASRIKVNKTVIEVEEGEIRRVIMEEIESE